MNPYGIFNSPSIAKINKNKPELIHLRLAKAVAVGTIKPASYFRTSTAETALDPNHPAWRHLPMSRLGLSEANLYETMRYYQHAISIHPPKDVVLVLDFFCSEYLSEE